LPLYILRSKACTRTNSKVFGFLIFEEPGRDYREGERREINFFFYGISNRFFITDFILPH
jgi:hypothetical protein